MHKQSFFNAVDTDKIKYGFIEQWILHFTKRDFLKQDIVSKSNPFCFGFFFLISSQFFICRLSFKMA